MKRACPLFCALLLLWALLPLTALPAGASKVNASGDYRYALNKSGEAVITAYIGMEAVLTIPGRVDGYPVIAIGEEAFYSRGSLVSVSLPEGLTRIESHAFDFCGSLKTLTLPGSLSFIGDLAFAACYSLESLTLPEGLTAIGDKAFSFSSLISLALPASLTQVGVNPWMYTPTSLTLASGNQVLTLRDGVLFHKGEQRLIRYPYGNSRAAFTVPEGTLVIGGGAFYGCEALTAITLPKGLHTIGENAFSGCKGLNILNLPPDVRIIGSMAFNGCEGLKTLPLPKGVEDLSPDAFMGCTALMLSVIPGSYAETRVLQTGVPFIYTEE